MVLGHHSCLKHGSIVTPQLFKACKHGFRTPQLFDTKNHGVGTSQLFDALKHGSIVLVTPQLFAAL